MEIKKEVYLRNICGDDVLIPTGATVDEYNGMFTLTPTGSVIFKAIEDGLDENGILERVLDEFDVEREVAEKDIADFLESLRDFGII